MTGDLLPSPHARPCASHSMRPSPASRRAMTPPATEWVRRRMCGSDDVEPGLARDRADRRRALVERAQRVAATLAEVERQLVHVHVHELSAVRLVETAAEAERVLERLVLVVERVLDAGAEAVGRGAHE